MSNSKYYLDNLTQYSGGYGTLYYRPNGAEASATVLNTDVHWMTTVNFSRTERTKSVWARGRGVYADSSIEIPITLEASPLMILLDDINGNVPHGTTNSDVDIPSYIFEYTYTIRLEELGKILDVIVLVNGNVISLDALDGTMGERYLITGIANNELYVSNTFDLPIANGSSPFEDDAYQDYPSNVGYGNVTSYKVNSIGWQTDYKGIFDIISLSNPGDGTISSITIPSGGGKLATQQLINYGKTQGLIAVKFRVNVNNNPPESGDTVLLIKTAVYKSGQVGNIDPEYPYAAAMRLIFKYDSSATEFEITGEDDINFSAAGTVGENEHQPSVTISSNIPWEITETEPPTA